MSTHNPEDEIAQAHDGDPSAEIAVYSADVSSSIHDLFQQFEVPEEPTYLYPDRREKHYYINSFYRTSEDSTTSVDIAIDRSYTEVSIKIRDFEAADRFGSKQITREQALRLWMPSKMYMSLRGIGKQPADTPIDTALGTFGFQYTDATRSQAVAIGAKVKNGEAAVTYNNPRDGGTTLGQHVLDIMNKSASGGIPLFDLPRTDGLAAPKITEAPAATGELEMYSEMLGGLLTPGSELLVAGEYDSVGKHVVIGNPAA